MEKKIYEGENLSNRDFSNQDLSNAQFVMCEFGNTLFDNANLSGAHFIRCTATGPVVFDRANMRRCRIEHSTFHNSEFNDVDLSYSHIIESEFSKSSLLACNFNGATIDTLDVSLCNLHLASLMNTQISSLKFMPIRKMPYLRGVKLFVKRAEIQQNTIFISGNKHLYFTEYCNSELRKGKLFASVNNSHPILHPFAVLFLLLYGLLTDFGQSFTRWALCTVGIVFFFSLIPLLTCDGEFAEMIKDSTMAFFGMGFENISWLYISESIIGYFMLGALISLLTSKLSID